MAPLNIHGTVGATWNKVYGRAKISSDKTSPYRVRFYIYNSKDVCQTELLCGVHACVATRTEGQWL